MARALPDHLIAAGLDAVNERHHDELTRAINDATHKLAYIKTTLDAGSTPNPSDLRALLADVAEAYARTTTLRAVHEIDRLARPRTDSKAPQP